MEDIFVEFKSECGQIVRDLRAILDRVEIEGLPVQRQLLTFAQLSDRVQGGAKTLALMSQSKSSLLRVGKVAEICKALGNQVAQLKMSQDVLIICVAVLQDAVGMMDELIGLIGKPGIPSTTLDTLSALLGRLQWLGGILKREIGVATDPELQRIMDELKATQ